MQILMIGGTQFIGRAVVERLTKRGDQVTVLHRGDSHELGADVQNARADRSDLAAVSRIIRDGGFDVVFDLAYDWANGTTADQVQGAAGACGDRLQRYVFIFEHGCVRTGLDRSETAALVPDDFPNPYAMHKASSERALFRMHAETGFPVTTFRPPFVHGPRQPFYREQFFWDRFRDGRPIVLPDGGDAPMQWAFVSDLAEACIRATEVPDAAGQAFNIGHVEPLTQRGFVEALARVAGLAPRFAELPRSAIQAAGGRAFGGNLYFGDFLDIPIHTTRIEKAPRVLGLKPTGFEAALAQGFAWYQAQPRRQVDYTFEDRLLAAAT